MKNKTDALAELGQMNALQEIFDNSKDMLCILDDSGMFTKTSKSWTTALGWSEQELCEMPWSKLVHPDDLQPTLDCYAETLNGKKTEGFKNKYLCKDGSYKTLQWFLQGMLGTLLFSRCKVVKD